MTVLESSILFLLGIEMSLHAKFSTHSVNICLSKFNLLILLSQIYAIGVILTKTEEKTPP